MPREDHHEFDGYKVAKGHRRARKHSQRTAMPKQGYSLVTIKSNGEPLMDITIFTPAEKQARKAAKKKGKK